MILGKLLNKEGKVEQYEKREALANVIPFQPKKVRRFAADRRLHDDQ